MQTLEKESFLQFPWMVGCVFGDSNYNLPKLSWLMGQFYEFFSSEMARLEVGLWNKKFDCDDFSSMFRVLAQICHKKSGGNAEGIAIAEIMYKQDSGGRHAINCAFTDKGPIFLEPQTGKQLLLTNDEILSIYYSHM